MSKNAGNIVLEAKNVVYYYKANKGKKVLDDISYGFEIGKMYAILGPSGVKSKFVCKFIFQLC